MYIGKNKVHWTSSDDLEDSLIYKTVKLMSYFYDEEINLYLQSGKSWKS